MTLAPASAASTSPTGYSFRYTGRRLDPETGLYYYRARYYSPRLGRYLQIDPIGTTDDLNLYAYTYNDSLNRTDPTGESAAVSIVIIGVPLAVGCAVTPSCVGTITDLATSVAGAVREGVGRISQSMRDAAATIVSATITLSEGVSEDQSSGDDKPSTDQPSSSDSKPRPRSNPLPGEPGTASETTTRDGRPKQTREYDDEGNAVRDVDYDHPHGGVQPHVHDWTPPAPGSPQTHTDRQPGRTPKPGEIEEIQNKCPPKCP